MKSAKKLYWSAYFDVCRNDMKKTRKVNKEIVNIKIGLNSNITQLNKNGKSITDLKEMISLLLMHLKMKY